VGFVSFSHLLVRSELMLNDREDPKGPGPEPSGGCQTHGRISAAGERPAPGKIGLFSTDALIDMLAKLGVSVRVAFVPSKSRPVAEHWSQALKFHPGQASSASTPCQRHQAMG
jgi:hypothetical protein